MNLRENRQWREALPHFVYRLYDADDNLLYIGCSRRVPMRIQDHRSNKKWGSRIARCETEGPFDNLFDGHTAEIAAIAAEQPVFNIAHRDIPQWILERHPERTSAQWIQWLTNARRVDAHAP